MLGLTLFVANVYADAPDQTGTGCANGTQYCENNNLIVLMVRNIVKIII